MFDQGQNTWPGQLGWQLILLFLHHIQSRWEIHQQSPPQCLFVEGRGVALALSIGVGQIGLIIARRRQRRYNVYGAQTHVDDMAMENDQENHIS